VSDGKILSGMKKTTKEKQLEILRGMGGAQRVQLGAELYEMAREISRAGIRDQFPDLSEKEVEEKLKERLPK